MKGQSLNLKTLKKLKGGQDLVDASDDISITITKLGRKRVSRTASSSGTVSSSAPNWFLIIRAWCLQRRA